VSEYEGREQSLVKHLILREYLERFAHKIFSWKTAITYVDCFSGPWNVRTDNLSDSSFSIALDELRKARTTWSQKRPKLRIRCFFIEQDRDAHAQLATFAAGVQDAEIETRNQRLEDAVPDIVAFIRDGGADAFPFFLIDPTGWTGFELDVIKPLLQQKPGEVLVNLMTSFIRRFIKSPDPQTQKSFERTFGPFKPLVDDLQGLAEEDLDDAIVDAYVRLMSSTGGYPVCQQCPRASSRDRQHSLPPYLRH
jgi:three-Cys-motif partner protein